MGTTVWNDKIRNYESANGYAVPPGRFQSVARSGQNSLAQWFTLGSSKINVSP